ncbi:DUF1176 domain-containing protein [Ahrensia kielensis]|uniref:DUF1176 domain-containing protein n=1 Tax=Ahrensia kielensis TaxID=76980 RepID=A0ABU9T6V0_9HYPH
MKTCWCFARLALVLKRISAHDGRQVYAELKSGALEVSLRLSHINLIDQQVQFSMTQSTRLTRNATIALWAMAICSMLIIGIGQSAHANQFKRVRDVNVACNNALLCNIYIANRSVSLSSFGFRRTAAPDSPVQMVISARPALRGGSNLQIMVDGEMVLELDVSKLSYRAATYEYLYNDQENVTKLMKAVRRGKQIQISYTTRSGRTTAPFSLSGITAGFIFADEAQGRIGSNNALMALSANVPTEADDAIEEVNITNYSSWSDVPADLLPFFGKEAGRCSNEIGEGQSRVDGGFSAGLDDGFKLIALPCGDAGAYNYPYAFWMQDGDMFTPLALPVMSNEGPSVSDLAWNIVWDGETRELYAFFKGRGLGDCGTSNRWTLADEAGTYRFVLVEALEKTACDGIYKEDLSDYKKLWPLN